MAVTESLLDTLTSDWKRLKQQKARKTGGVEGRVLLNLAFIENEHYTDYKNSQLFNEPQDPNKLYLVFNLIGPRLRKLLGRLSAISPVFKARPDRKDPKAFAEAEVVDKLILALDEKLNQPARFWEILWWLAVGGVAFEYVPWVPNASMELMPITGPGGEILYKDLLTGEVVGEPQMQAAVAAGRAPESFDIAEEVLPVGDVGSEVFGPLNVFVDQSVKSIDDLAPDQRVYIAKVRTLGWIEENFNTRVEPDGEFSIINSRLLQQGDSVGGHYLQDLLPLIQGSVTDEDKQPVALVIESYTPASRANPRGRYEVFCPGKQILHSDVNPYEEIPLVDFHWRPVTTTFWTSDYVTDLIAPQRFLNKRLSQLGEQSNATLYSQLLLGGALDPKDISADAPGAVKGAVADNGVPLVQRLPPPEIPTWFLNSIEIVVKLFNDIAGGADLMEEQKFPGQLRGPLAVPMLQEIIDTEWGPFYAHLGERLARVKQMRLNRVKQFYPPQRTLHYTNRDQKDEVITFHTEAILRRGTNYNITVERGALMPELRALREARVRERLQSPLAIMYLDERTGRLDKTKIAEDLQFGDLGRESREAQYRKLGQEIVDMLWKGQTPPPVLPFYDHVVMMDELEAAMATTEFLRASPQVQQLFMQRWEEHRFYLAQEAANQQRAMQAGMIQNAVAQATQQAAAQAAADAVSSAQRQVSEQNELVRSGQTRAMVQAANQGSQRAGGKPGPGSVAPKNPGVVG